MKNYLISIFIIIAIPSAKCEEIDFDNRYIKISTRQEYYNPKTTSSLDYYFHYCYKGLQMVCDDKGIDVGFFGHRIKPVAEKFPESYREYKTYLNYTFIKVGSFIAIPVFGFVGLEMINNPEYNDAIGVTLAIAAVGSFVNWIIFGRKQISQLKKIATTYNKNIDIQLKTLKRSRGISLNYRF